MKLYLTILNDDGSEAYEIGEFDSVEDLKKWAEDTTDEDVFVES